MVFRAIAALALAASTLLIPADSLGGTVRPAPGSRSSLPASYRTQAFTGFAPGALAAPVVDPVRHLVFGLSDHAVRVLNESTGHSRQLTNLGRQIRPIVLAVDPAARRLVVEAMKIDAVVGPRREGQARVTVFAVDIDEQTGRVVAMPPASTFLLRAFYESQGSVAVDSELHPLLVSGQGGV